MKKKVASLLKKAIEELPFKNKPKMNEKEILKLIETPPSYDLGDFAFPCFFLAKELKANPKDLALEIRQKIGSSGNKDFQDITTQGPYVNFFINRKKLALDLIKLIEKQGEDFGKTDLGKKTKTMIEFSQPNTHKAFHVGHIRGTSIGESLSRISEFNGENIIRANYSGDTGMHIAKWIWCYKKYHAREKLKEDESWVAGIYVDAVKRLARARSDKAKREVEKINRKLDSKEDKEINELWKKTRELSIKSWIKIYDELNTFFDIHFFESQVEKRGKEIALELLKKGIAEKSDEAVIMNLKEYNLGVWILLRRDGTVLYSAKDLALAEKKFDEYKIEKNINVVGAAQTLHMKQLFKTLELMKFKNSDKCVHIPFAEVRLPTGKMSSRTGENILYSDFIEEVKKQAKKNIKKSQPKVSKKDLEEKAEIVSIAAIKYSMLKQNPKSFITFDKKEALNFEGDTGPYLLYSYARASSILRKTKKKKGKIKINELEKKEQELVLKLSEFLQTSIEAYENLNPSIIVKYSYELSKTFNEFYHSCPVINSENERFRMRLVDSFRQVLKNALYLLGIEVLEKM